MNDRQTNMNQHDQFIQTSQGIISIWDTKPHSESQKPTVILLHGNCTNKSFFSKQLISPLFAKYRLIALDLPGHGKSSPPNDPQKVYSLPGYADVVKEVIHLIKLDNVIVVGWSLGGHVALELTSRLPQLKGILITGTPPMELSAKGLSKGFKINNPKILECFGKGNLTYEEAQLFATISGYDYSEEKKFIVDAILQTDEAAKIIYPKSLLNGIGQDELKIVSEWPQPIAVIAGENDLGINNDYLIQEVKFKKLWEGKVHIIPNGGHTVFIEYPVEFNQIMERFLNEIFR